MYISDLQEGTPVTLEIVKGERPISIGTSVIGVTYDLQHEPHVLLKPFVYQGNVIDLGGKSFEKDTFNLYANDTDGSRICWAEAKVETKKHRDELCYSVWVLKHRRMAVQSERRDHERYTLKISGTATEKVTNIQHNVVVNDISDNGISFICEEELKVLNAPLIVSFSEVVKDKTYNLLLDCKCVRIKQREDGFLYGCSVTSVTNQMLAYVYLKKIIAKYQPDETVVDSRDL